jgi:anti-sigma regulatory factor (Ser/Thr protein kinase)
VLLAVRDFGAWTAADEANLRGRGLGMISELMDAVEITSGDAGTKILMRRTLKP